MHTVTGLQGCPGSTQADLHNPVAQEILGAILPQSIVVACQAVLLPQVDLPPGLGLAINGAGPSKVHAQEVATHDRLWIGIAAHWTAC